MISVSKKNDGDVGKLGVTVTPKSQEPERIKEASSGKQQHAENLEGRACQLKELKVDNACTLKLSGRRDGGSAERFDAEAASRWRLPRGNGEVAIVP